MRNIQTTLYCLALLAMASTPLQTFASPPLSIQLSQPFTNGSLQILVFDSPEAFEDFSAPVRALRIPAEGQQTLHIPEIPAGEYAILVYHDENDNQQLDRNFIGIPSEPVGFSNDYRPRGAPTFASARFVFAPGNTPPVDMHLARPLGERGRIGAGVAIIARGSPYKQSTDSPMNILPALVYIGNRVQITGPYAQIGIIGRGRSRLAATLAYRQATYEEDDSPILAGMRDRYATAMAGMSLEMDLRAGFNFSAGFQIDALNRIGGTEGSISFSRPIPWERFRFTPSIGLTYMLSEITRHDYGVSPAEATPTRTAYRPGDALNPEIGLSVFAEITPHITGAVMTSVEWFDSSIRNSPIVDENHVLKGSAFVVYMF